MPSSAARSTTSGSRAQFSSTVSPSASVAAISTGMIVNRIRPSRKSMNSRATSTPMNVSTELTMVISPVCRNVDSASTSVVIRVMIRPDSSCS